MSLKINKNKKIDVSVIGRVTIDFNPTDYYNTLDKNKNFNMYLGGSAGNIVVGLLRYKRNVNFISRISNDQFGTFIKNYYINEGLDIGQLQIDNELKTGLTFTEMLNDKQSNILMYREAVADLNIQFNEINYENIRESKLTLISGVSLAKDPARKSCLEVAKIASDNDSVVVFDLDYRPYTWKNREEIHNTYKKVARISKILIGSEEEFNFLLERDAQSDKDYENLFRDLFKNNSAEIIVLKKGSKGSTLYTKDKKINIGIAIVKLLKGFGGGDAYMSAFLNSLLNDENNLKEALHNATCAASMVVSHLSSSEGLPTQENLEHFKTSAVMSSEASEMSWEIDE
ncbi:5-dehydro-2-deoxygluconokinase [Spiroplasma chinense]|uniref:5-dehydro-2-deoxygluconokinase n=1 Tax=Spiroplasma chinense TaxID=216932 RepID=A0A5B9Y3W3_9MOLU|nr:5-dehydro-2-deoxygluconokinase [Spiroplasma chinense]QEH61848.1 5-dehydro-2-deoxygluconokinase [Spiroplasma chinense]